MIASAVLFAILFTLILPAGVFAAQSKQMTSVIFAQKLESFKRDVYANGSTYVNNASVYRGTQCYGFANQIALYFYGSFPTYNATGLQSYPDWTVSCGSEALQNLHIGDIVRFRSSAGADHSIFITGMDSSKIYFSDANNDHRNTVRHDAEMTWEKIIGKIDKALECDASCIGWVAHYKYWDDDPDHTGVGTTLVFKANGGDTGSKQYADRYIVLDALNMRSGPGVNYDRVKTMYDYTYFDVPCGAQTVNADGYTWAPVTQGSKSGWAVISDKTWCKYIGPAMSGDYYVNASDETIYKTADLKQYNVSVTVDAVLPTADDLGLICDNFEFAGWSVSENGETVSMQNIIKEPHGETLVLYAVWKPTETDTDGADSRERLLKGDVNDDGETNNKDVMTLFNLLSSSQNADPELCDVNGDGFADNKDLMYLFRMVTSMPS